MKARIAAGDRQTAQAGRAILRAGGNAVDAAVAAAFASFLTEPLLASPAGAGVALHGDAARGFEVLDFFTVVPGIGAQPPAQLDFHEITIDFGTTSQSFHVGRGAASVPTAMFGLLQLHQRGGRAPLSEVVAPAVALARHGCLLSASLRYVTALLTPIVSLTPQVEALYSADGMIAPPGTQIRNEKLADFLEALGTEGESLLRGAFADALVDAFSPDNGGLLTREDIDRYKPVVRKPLRVAYGDLSVLTNPPPSTGGTLIGIGLRAAAAADLGQHAFLSPDHVIALADVLSIVSHARRSEVDRRIEEPGAIAELLDDATIARWRKEARGVSEEAHLGGTTHISVIDKDGGVVSMTLTNGEGCGHALAGLGIHVNNFLGEDDINPLGFHKLAAGTRMTTMMAPSVVVEGGQPRFVLGSGGSNRIRSAILHGVLNHLAFGQTLDVAVNAPRMHVEGNKLWFEAADMPAESVAALVERWPDAAVFEDRSMFFGGVNAVGLDGAGGDRRRGGTPLDVD